MSRVVKFLSGEEREERAAYAEAERARKQFEARLRRNDVRQHSVRFVKALQRRCARMIGRFNGRPSA